jgi:hypothetical protein
LHASGKEEYEGWLAERRNMKEATKQGGGSGSGSGARWRSKQAIKQKILAWLTSVIVVIPNQ